MTHSRIPVLLYHLVSRRPVSRADMVVTPARFAQHVRGIARLGYVGITAREWLDHLDGRAPLPPKPVLFTFDDGYAELPEHAFPVLERHGFGAVVFLVTQRIGGRADWAADADVQKCDLMTEEAIREWSARGIEFASHTRTHPDLQLLSRDSMVSEVRDSRRDVEALGGRASDAFAYPYGRFTDEVVTAVTESYGCAFSARPGVADFAAGRWRLARITVSKEDTWPEVAFALRVGWRPRSLIRRLRARTACSPF